MSSSLLIRMPRAEHFFVFTQLFCKKSFLSLCFMLWRTGGEAFKQMHGFRRGLPKTLLRIFAGKSNNYSNWPVPGQKEVLMSDKRFVLASSRAEWTIDLLMLPPVSSDFWILREQTSWRTVAILLHFNIPSLFFFPSVFQWTFLNPLMLLANFILFASVFSMKNASFLKAPKGQPIKQVELTAWSTNLRGIFLSTSGFPMVKKKHGTHYAGPSTTWSHNMVLPVSSFQLPFLAKVEHQELRFQGLWPR